MSAFSFMSGYFSGVIKTCVSFKMSALFITLLLSMSYSEFSNFGSVTAVVTGVVTDEAQVSYETESKRQNLI